MTTTTETSRSRIDLEDAAASHLAGIEGGLKGAVRHLLAGRSIDYAAGLGDSWGALPEGWTQEEVEVEVRRQLREAAEEAREEQKEEEEEALANAVIQAL